MKQRQPMAAMQLAFLAFLVLFHTVKGVGWPWELGLVLLGSGLLMWPRLRGTGAQLLPFAIIFVDYLSLRSYVSSLSPDEINIENLIRWERTLFGGVLPPVWIQERFFGQALTPLLDVLSNRLYLMHFPLPIIFAVWLHWKHPNRYWTAMSGFLLLSLLGFVSYLCFPAAPPWWATRNGFIGEPGADLSHFISADLITVMSPNPIAAMPSLHAAYPLYFAFMAIGLAGRRLAWTLALPLGVGAATVYLGHHYVIDALAGYVYAAVVALGVSLVLACSDHKTKLLAQDEA